MKKKLLSLICAMALCLTLLPAGALASDAVVYVEDGMDLTYGGSHECYGGGTATYDPETNVLTLEDANFLAMDTSYDSAITAFGNLTIELKGKNVIAAPEILNGIYVSGDLTICGDGSLTIAVPAYGIRAEESLTIESGDIDVLSETDDAVYVEGACTLEGGNLSVTGECGIFCYSKFAGFEIERGAHFTADCTEAAIKIARYDVVDASEAIKLYDSAILPDGLVLASVASSDSDKTAYTIAPSGSNIAYSSFTLTGAEGSLSLPKSGYEVVEEKYAISTDVGEHGSLTVAVNSASRGTEVLVSAYPDDEYILYGLYVVDANGDNVVVKKATGEPNYTFIMPTCAVTVYATFRERDNELIFDDVSIHDWYYDAVDYASRTGLISGVSALEFGPDIELTRAMAATLVWRFEGCPWFNGDNNYRDVAESDWYFEAVGWADEADIVSGYGEGSFAPNNSITREQLATILYRYAAAKGVSVSDHADLTGYDDYDDISPYALDALSWACAEGLMNGRTESTIDPQGTATRAEAAAIFMRFDENVM